ncbi:MAG: hypothetical protein ABSG51_02485 [Terracidiphilus sp.]|jgi:hypothetical protein
MKTDVKIRFGATLLALLIAQRTSAQRLPVQAAENAEVYREIDDPSTGSRWLLTIDPRHPGGPGRLLPAEAQPKGRSPQTEDTRIAAPVAVPVIHAGDRVIVEEHSEVAEARLEGFALGPAAVGAPLSLRLVIGGRVVRAVAAAPGRAILQPGMQLGMQPGMQAGKGERP